MKHDAIVEQGIPIIERVPIPDDMIPEDSRVEIDAKIHAGYCKYLARIPSVMMLIFPQSQTAKFCHWTSCPRCKDVHGKMST